MSHRTRWTAEAVRELGLTTDIETAGQILGIGRTKAYEMARNNQFPVRVFRVGNRYRVATQAILELLGHDVAGITHRAGGLYSPPLSETQ